jgi:hypothetical protein
MSGITHLAAMTNLATATPAVATVAPTATHMTITHAAFDRSLLLRTVVLPLPPAPPNLPLLASRNGSLFTDARDAKVRWYLPAVTLAADVDSAFGFAATQSGQDVNGNPFYNACLTLQVRKSLPDDAAAFAQANPTVTLREIPLQSLRALLDSAYTDSDGKPQTRTLEGAATDLGNGNVLLTFAAIVGPAVLGVYQDLVTFGKARIELAGNWTALSTPVRTLPPFRFAEMARTVMPPPVAATSTARIAPAARSIVAGDNISRVFVRDPHRVDPPPTLLPTTQTWSVALPLNLKYKQDGYQLKYTVATTNAAAHPIRDVNDLRDFDRGASEFTELRQLGAINASYPSIARAYYGVFSKTIIVIPRRYAIARGAAGCAAQCFAVVDSAPSSASRSKFEFDFTLAADVSPIELQQFAHAVAQCPDLAGYTVRLPYALRNDAASQLQEGFVTQTQFSAGGLDAGTFTLTTTIVDADAQTPAVAYANMLIAQLCPTHSGGATLGGNLSLKLDDAYTQPVTSPFVLNFAHTAGATDAFAVRIDDAAGQLVLTNVSPLDVQLSRYAFLTNGNMTVTASSARVAAGDSLTLALPAEHAQMDFMVEAQLALPDTLTKNDIAQLLTIKTVDVQQTQYVIAISAGGLDFNVLDSVRANITFANLPGVAPPALTLTRDVRANSTSIVVPIENAMFTLPGTVQLTASYADKTRAATTVTLQHDFTEQPVLVLDPSDLTTPPGAG